MELHECVLIRSSTRWLLPFILSQLPSWSVAATREPTPVFVREMAGLDSTQQEMSAMLV